MFKNYFKKDALNKYSLLFSIDIEDIPINYSGEVWFSFDKEGIYKIPQNHLVNIDAIDINSTIVNLERRESLINNNFLEKRLMHPELKEYWDEIISNEEFLNTLENFIMNKKYSSRKNSLFIELLKNHFD